MTAIVASVAVATLIAVLAGRSHLARHLGKDLDRLPESELALRIQQLIELGEPGITELTEALNSEQVAVARAAKTALSDQLNHWRTLDADAACPKVAHLVHQLAVRLPQYRPRARDAAGELAVQALDWKSSRASVDRTQFISDCAILVRATTAGRILTMPDEPSHILTDTRQGSLPPEPNDDVAAFQQRRATPTERVESRGPQSVPLQHRDPAARVARGPLTHRTPPPSRDSATIEFAPQPSVDSSDDETTGKPAPPPARLAPPLTRPVPWDPRRALPVESPTARELGGTYVDSTIELALQDDVTLMHRLHASSPDVVEAARLELRRRGFDGRYLRMAEDLTNPDSTVRVHFAQTLPAIRDIDVRPWLRTLAEDEDPRVRQAAIAVIATLGTPESRSWLRRLQLTEEHPEVQRQLQRILDRP